MKKTKYMTSIWTLLLCGAVLTACSDSSATTTNTNASTPSEVTNQNNTAEVEQVVSSDLSELVTYDEDDTAVEWSEESSTMIEFSGSGASVQGEGAAEQEGTVTISEAGTYVLSGTLEDGQVVVDVQDDGIVHLVLNGVSLNSSDSAPIYVKAAGKTVVTLEEGTNNTVSDGQTYVYDDEAEKEPNAAIFSKDDLTINGSGQLSVVGHFNNGVGSKDDLKIVSGTIEVQAVDDGIQGRDMVAVQDGMITIEAGGDGVKSTNDTDTDKGFIAIQGGSFTITSGSDGLQAASAVQIDGGEFDITTGGGSVNGEVKTVENDRGPWGGTAEMESTTEETDSTSAKGVKAAETIMINSGFFQIDSADDAVHSNSNIVLTDGELQITSGDDGIHADTSIVINGGVIHISKSYEGIESSDVTITGGTMDVTASDDGINVAGGNDGSSVNGRPGQNGFSSSSNSKLTIQGGDVVVNAAGDGLDANGSMYITGGMVVVNGPTSNGNGALDYDGTFEMSGGVLIAAGSSGMLQAPTDDSAQHSVAMSFSQMQEAGTFVHLEDSQGNVIVSFAPAKEFGAVVISSPDLSSGETYTLFTGGTSTGSETNGLYLNGEVQGGTEVVQFEVTEKVTWLNESGVTDGMSGGPGMPGGFGRGGAGPEGESPEGERPMRMR
ncbi:carbohydrate-binding domain-containing protein [Marinicrinis lubricantis]|uniref:Carbohydrate-binding domain-containing protein n=1 Tax=Marinicrinis lubricantis TaxID=2086470 RepID=A0ABW1ISY4_9BACL